MLWQSPIDSNLRFSNILNTIQNQRQILDFDLFEQNYSLNVIRKLLLKYLVNSQEIFVFVRNIKSGHTINDAFKRVLLFCSLQLRARSISDESSSPCKFSGSDSNNTLFSSVVPQDKSGQGKKSFWNLL